MNRPAAVSTWTKTGRHILKNLQSPVVVFLRPFAKEECFIVSPWAVKPVYTSHHVDIPPNICHLSQKSVQAECFCSETWTSAQVTLPLTAPQFFLPISFSLSQPPFLLSLITIRCIKRVDWGSHVLRARCGLTLRQIHTHTHTRTHTHTHTRCDKMFPKAWSLSDLSV